MNQPIDDLLYGGDDSGDEDMSSLSMRQPISATPLAPPAHAASLGGPLGPRIPIPPNLNTVAPPASISTVPIATSTPAVIAPPPTLVATATSGAPNSSVTSTGQVAPSRQSWGFKQMFALLKILLPPDQYATLNSEMRKVNGNDKKAIVDIIKRIAGSQIFNSVMLKLKQHNAALAANGELQGYSNGSSMMPNTRPNIPVSQQIMSDVTKSMHLAPPASVVNSVKVENSSTGASNPKFEEMEHPDKIAHVQKSLMHAINCQLEDGKCPMKNCAEIRRVIGHVPGCSGCFHCEKLGRLVKYHSTECMIPLGNHCRMPFCDELRPTYSPLAKNRVHSQALESNVTNGMSSEASALQASNSKALAKKASKSPKSSRTGSPASNKKKSSPGGKTSPSTSSGATTTQTTTTAPRGGATAAKTIEYGRLLQLILHAQKCTAVNCPVGSECAESKELLQQMNSPQAPPRANTYRQVLGHHKVCLMRNNTSNCQLCKIGMQPISSSEGQTGGLNGAIPPSTNTAASPGLKRSLSGGSSPRSPQKKWKTSNQRKNSASTSNDIADSENPADDLLHASFADVRREADVLTHTGVDLNSERRSMLEKHNTTPIPELLKSQKVAWMGPSKNVHNLFSPDVLERRMKEVAAASGVTLGKEFTREVMNYGLQEYLKQAMEELVEIAKQRGDAAKWQHNRDKNSQFHASNTGTNSQQVSPAPVEVTSTDILRVSCEDSYARVRDADLQLRSRLLEEAKREAEQERSRKRKKVDRSKSVQDDKLDEVDMDIEELACKDLKERLIQDERDGISRVSGRVNESISRETTSNFVRSVDNQVNMEDVYFWLQSQRPYINPEMFVRAEAARIMTNSLT